MKQANDQGTKEQKIKQNEVKNTLLSENDLHNHLISNVTPQIQEWEDTVRKLVCFL